MRMHDLNCMAVQELFQVLVKMAVVIIAIGAEMKIIRIGSKLLHGLPDPHDL